MKAIAILEQQRLSSTLECVTDYTLVGDPFSGECRRLTKVEARDIIGRHNLQRYEVTHKNEESGMERLGAIWDTDRKAYLETYGAVSYAARLKASRAPRSVKGEERTKILKDILDLKREYKEDLAAAIEKMFNEKEDITD